MMKKTLSLFLCLVLMMSLCSTAMAIGMECEHWTQDNPCNAWFKHIENTQTHHGYCSTHDSVFTEPGDCTIGSDGACAYCHFDYTPDPVPDPTPDRDSEAMSLEMLMAAFYGATRPLSIEVAGASATLALSSEVTDEVYANGGYVSESLSVPTTYTLKLSGGTSYAYTGSAITPATLEKENDYLSNWLQEHFWTFKISQVTYENNTEPGTATAKVTFSLDDRFYEELSVNFTITSASSGDGDTDSGDSDNTGSGNSAQYTVQNISSGNIYLHGELTPDARLIVTPIGTGHSDYQKLAAHDDAKGREMIAAYDVSVLGDYRGELELMFPVDEQYKDSEITVLHGKGDGLVESHTVTVTENVHGACVIIRVDSLSPFMLLGEKAEATPTPVPAVTAAPTQAPEATTAPGGSVTAAPTATLTPTETPGAVELPATGDSSQLALWMALLLVSCIGVVLLNAAKRTGRQ